MQSIANLSWPLLTACFQSLQTSGARQVPRNVLRRRGWSCLGDITVVCGNRALRKGCCIICWPLPGCLCTGTDRLAHSLVVAVLGGSVTAEEWERRRLPFRPAFLGALGQPLWEAGAGLHGPQSDDPAGLCGWPIHR